MSTLQKNISLNFSLVQSYKREEEANPGATPPTVASPSIYTEAASISKVNIEQYKTIRITEPLFMLYNFKSKLAFDNPVNLAFVLSDDLEIIFNDSFYKYINDKQENFFTTPIAPGFDIPPIESEELNKAYPYLIAYREIQEFSDYPANTVKNYPKTTFARCLDEGKAKLQIVNFYALASSTFQSNEDILIFNQNDAKYLYIFPFLPKLQGTEIAMAGRCNFRLEIGN